MAGCRDSEESEVFGYMPYWSAAMSRRHFLKTAAAATALGAGGVGLLSACSTASKSTASSSQVERVRLTSDLVKAAQKEGRVVVRYSTPVDTQKAMADAFTKQYGIEVQLDRKVGVVGNQAFAQEERSGKHVMDVNDSVDPPGLRKLATEGLYLRFTLPDVVSKMPKGAYISDLAYSYELVKVVIQYNPSKISTSEAESLFKTWEGLLDPSLKGKIGMTEPGGGGVPFGTYLMFYRLPKYGREYLVKLAAQKPRLYSGSAPGREDLAAGAISVFIPNWEQIGMQTFMTGDQTRWTYPEAAPVFPNDLLAINKKAPHPSAARLWVAWLLSPDGGAAIEGTGALSTVPGIPDKRAALERLKQTDWWKPYPDKNAWVPDRQDWDSNYDKLMPDMRRVLGWQG